MKQKIEIEVPEGKKAIWKDDKIIFEDIAPKLPETWEEFCKLYPQMDKEYYIAIDSNIICCGGRRVAVTDKNMLTSRKDAEAHLALMQLHQLRDCYRQGWIPDWNNNSDKYCIEYWGSPEEYKIRLYTHCSKFLSFQSQELAEKFLKNFIVLIKQAGDLI